MSEKIYKTYDIDAVEFYTRPIPQVHIIGAYFAFTGNFKYGFKEDVIRATEEAGGAFGRNIVDYLVVGEKLKKNQGLPFLSSQIEEALLYRNAFGANTSIVPESAWFAGLQNPTSLPASALERYPHNKDEENTIWEGEKHIRLRYEMMFKDEGIHDHDVILYQITARLDTRAVYLCGRKTGCTNAVFRANRISSDIFDVDAGMANSVNAFLQQLTGHDYRIEPFSGQIGDEFAPFITLDCGPE